MNYKHELGDIVEVIGQGLTGNLVGLGCVGEIIARYKTDRFDEPGMKNCYKVNFNFKNNIGKAEEGTQEGQWWIREKDLKIYGL